MRLIYVAGWLRSGTTMLTRMLGSIEGVTAIGEVSGIWNAASGGEVCSCGAAITECPIWSAGLQAVDAAYGIGPAEYSDFAALTKSVLRSRRCHGLVALRRANVSRWPEDVRRYVEVVGTLLEAVTVATGGDVLVDSSKLPPGLLTLGLIPGAALDVVHIVRDPRAVANSELRSLKKMAAGMASEVPGRTILRSAIYWSAGNLAVKWFGRYAQSFTALRYEALASHPASELRSLAHWLGLEHPPSDAPQLALGHVGVGNPSRFGDPRGAIRPDTAWTWELSLPQRALVGGVSLPARALLHNGYGLHGSH